MNKLTDAEIVKVDVIETLNNADGMEHISIRCFDRNGENETVIKVTDIIETLNRQKAEIENNAQFTMQNSQLELLREKCIEHQDFHKGEDGVFRGYIAIEDLDRIVDELGIRN